MMRGPPTRSASWSSGTGRWPARPNTSAIRLSRDLRVLNGSSGCPETEPGNWVGCGFCSRWKYSFALRLGLSGGAMSTTFEPIDELCINTIRTLSIDAVQKANSGHPGMPLGAAPMAYVLWTRHLRHSPTNPKWPDRDRFVLSAGHASMLLYSMLFLTGYDLTMDDIKQFRQWGSRTPGHPEYGVVPGAEVTTGPLGQGVGNAVGLAMAERWLAATFNRPGHEVV